MTIYKQSTYGIDMAKLARAASGNKQLRWGREIRATANAHAEVNYLLTDQQRDVLRAEVVRLDRALDTLAMTVNPYRDFIANSHVDIRARQRVANFLCDEAQRDANGLLRNRQKEANALIPGGYKALFGGKNNLSRVLRAGNEATVKLARNTASGLRMVGTRIPGADTAAAALERAAMLLDGFNQERQSQDDKRQPLREATLKAVAAMREELDKMDGRLREHFSQEFIDSLYPELARNNTALADEPDDEDDDSAEPDSTPAAPATQDDDSGADTKPA